MYNKPYDEKYKKISCKEIKIWNFNYTYKKQVSEIIKL